MFDYRAGRMVCQLLLLVVAIVAKLPGASAHEGPPFPILMDKPVHGLVISVWADPDIGQATFFVIVESPGGGPPNITPTVSMWAEPVSGRLDRATYEAKQDTVRNQMQFQANPIFDRRDLWNVGFELTTPGGQTEELTAQVESTPPGFGLWDLAIYGFPFSLLGGMWLIAMARRRQRMKGSQSQTTISRTEQACRDHDLAESTVGHGK